MSTLHTAVGHGNVRPESDAEPNDQIRELLEHLARIAYVADRHREALAGVSGHRAAVKAELRELGAQS